MDPLDIQRHANSEAVAAVLLHKIMRAARVQVRGITGICFNSPCCWSC
jgi:hypothetical protein